MSPMTVRGLAQSYVLLRPQPSPPELLAEVVKQQLWEWEKAERLDPRIG